MSRLGHTYYKVYLFNIYYDRCGSDWGGKCHLLGECLYEVGPAPGVGNIGNTRLLLENELCVASDASAELGRQPERFIEC